MTKERVLIFGTGQGAIKTLSTIDESIELIGFIDNNEEKQGSIFRGKVVYAPKDISTLSYDTIVICSVAYPIIEEQLIELGINKAVIKDRTYFHTKRFLAKYDIARYQEDDEIKPIINYVKEKGLKVFNYPFNDMYNESFIDVHYDSEKELYYVLYNQKKMYMSKNYTEEEQVRGYVRSLLKEQDNKSPHRYLTDSFYVRKGSTVIDAGVAEGNFALDIIDDVEQIILVEADDAWIDALHYTFEPYKEKVNIVKGFLSNRDEEGNVTLDRIANGKKIDFIKMDIEGAEPLALEGARKILQQDNIQLDICVYHNDDDEKTILDILKDYQFQTSCSEGYMVFLVQETFQTNEEMSLVRGLVRAWK